MERRTQNYRIAGEDRSASGQTFDRFRAEYRLNEATNELEEDGLVDIIEEVNSCRDLALDRQIERFLPVTEDQFVNQEFSGYRDALDEARAYRDKIESYRDKFGLSEDATDQDVVSELSRRSEALKERLDRYQTQEKLKEVVSNEKNKEVVQAGE